MSNKTPAAEKPLLKSRFRFAHRFLLFPKAQLYQDRVVFSGIGWAGRYSQTVYLGDVDSVKWWAGNQHIVNFALHLHDDTSIKVWIKGGGLWKFKIEEILGKQVKMQEALPGSLSSASAA
ncbi:MAG TPA: hypothetical protein VKP65_03890 [Rhodothermales bacterium]|nr:hypothetical protein [Rhodothermales bacterium]